MCLKSTKYVISISLYQFSIFALLNVCSVISYTTGMVQLNKDDVFGFALKWQECRMWPDRWPGRRVPTIHAIVKNYRKYRQHGTSLNRNKVNSGRYL